jgi:hypothetical protein
MKANEIKIGDWVQIDWAADVAKSQQGEVIWTDGVRLVARKASGKQFEALVADAHKRERP